MLDARLLAVVSPHLDDAALSVGAAIAAAARAGSAVVVVTVFAGDPESRGPAGAWDARCGFESEGEAARARRAEDERACAMLGAKAVWLPFKDESYGREERPAAEDLARSIAGADAVLLPGLPLTHPDHALVSSWWTDLAGVARTGFYVEQPYTIWEVVGARPRASRLALQAGFALRAARARSVQARALASRTDGRMWEPAPASAADRRQKRRAIEAYASQFPHLGRPLVRQIALWERSYGGEAIAWV